MDILTTCQPGYEEACAAEVRVAGYERVDGGVGWVGFREVPEVSGQARGWGNVGCFPWIMVKEPEVLEGTSVNGLGRVVAEAFGRACAGERVEGAWPLVFSAAAAVPGLAARAKAVEVVFREEVGRRMARVLRLATPDVPRGPWEGAGWLVHFAAHGRVCVARRWVAGGQRRMADDPGAPSRSYLKAEEAYVVLGREPAPGETVVDLGAAPGGWSYSAAKRGARVVAVDNGPLKGAAAGHPAIRHVREDAFRYQPEGPVDWLFCDLVEEPHHVWRLVRGWLAEGWCGACVVNLKFGRADPIELLRLLAGSPERAAWGGVWRVRHLFHDREEFTLVASRAEAQRGGGPV